jgi:prepilin-type N-terminal cleavage/methylation domain-containing protein/prepilin-type processing-associated H-X9-DG protein
MKTQCAAKQASGMTLIEVLVVIFVIALLAAILLAALAAAKQKHSHIGCINNLKEIDLAFRVWEGDNGDKYPMQFAVTNSDTMKLINSGSSYVLWQTMSNELSTPRVLHCPEDTEHLDATNNFSTGFSDVNISYFFNLDGTETYPQMILTGDDNLAVNGLRVQPGILNLITNSSVTWTKERHNGSGNIGIADGSVQQVSSKGLNFTLANSAVTNQPAIRLVIP